jgi:hypothetical protein
LLPPQYVCCALKKKRIVDIVDTKDNSMWTRVNSSTIVKTATQVFDPNANQLVYVNQASSEIKLSDKEKRKNLIQEPVTAKGYFRLPFTDDSVMKNTGLKVVSFDMIFFPGMSGILMTGLVTMATTVTNLGIAAMALFAIPGLLLGGSGLGIIVNSKTILTLRKIEALNLRYFDRWLVSQGINISAKEVRETMDYIRLGHEKIQVAGTNQILIKADERLGAYEVKKAKPSSERSNERAARAKQYAIEDVAKRKKKAEVQRSDFESNRKELCDVVTADHKEAVTMLGSLDSGLVNLEPVRKELNRIGARVEELTVFRVTEKWQYKAVLRELKTLKKDVKVTVGLMGTASYRQVDALNRKLTQKEQDVAARQPTDRASSLVLSKEPHV